MYSISFTRTQCSEYWVYWCEHFRNCYNKTYQYWDVCQWEHTYGSTQYGSHLVRLSDCPWIELVWTKMGNMADHSVEILHESYNSLRKTYVSNYVFFQSSKMIKQMRTQTLLWIIKFSKIDKLLTRKKYFIFEVLFQFLLSPDPYIPSKLLISF